MNSNFTFIFGNEAASAKNIREAAQVSKKSFLRTTGQLYNYAEPNFGRKISAFEALERYGIDVIKDVVNDGVAVIFGGKGEPGKTLKERRESCDISIESLTNTLNVDIETIRSIENNTNKYPIRLAEKMAAFLDLDDCIIANEIGAHGDPDVATRLRKKGTNKSINESDKIKFLEAAWVIRTYYRLREYLGEEAIDLKTFEETPFFGQYGSYEFKTFLVGYELANFVRKKLEIDEFSPIPSMRVLCEEQLNIPIVSSEIDSQIFGATINSNNSRGILTNYSYDLSGIPSKDVYVRRNTIAHELCHCLFDGDEYLDKIIIDNKITLSELSDDFNNENDISIERRANAFAAEFLAPQEAALEIFKSKYHIKDGIRAVMEHFGVSFSVAKFQVQNADKKIKIHNMEYFQTDTASWIAAEDSITSYLPDEYRASPQRMGKFAKLVLLAQKQGFISDQTADVYLGAEVENTSLRQKLAEIILNERE